jgi:hypothetical protein
VVIVLRQPDLAGCGCYFKMPLTLEDSSRAPACLHTLRLIVIVRAPCLIPILTFSAAFFLIIDFPLPSPPLSPGNRGGMAPHLVGYYSTAHYLYSYMHPPPRDPHSTFPSLNIAPRTISSPGLLYPETETVPPSL